MKTGNLIFSTAIAGVLLMLGFRAYEAHSRAIASEPITTTATAITPTANAELPISNTAETKIPLIVITARDLPYGEPQAFIDALMPYAKAIEADYGIPAKVIVAQAALETGWGKRIQENNILGIGHTVGKRHLGKVKRNGKFVKLYVTTYPYDSINDCLEAYAEMISTKPNYKTAMANAGDYKLFIKGLQKGGYCRYSNYGRKLNQIINRYDFD